MLAAVIDRDRSLERPGHRVEGVDLAGDKAEIADEQSPLNGPKPVDGARAIPQGDASLLSVIKVCE